MKKMLIDSQWVESSDGKWMEIHNPGTGELLDEVPVATLADAERAVKAAQTAKLVMSRLPAHKRAAILKKIGDAIESHQAELGDYLARENGKPVQQTRAEVGVTANIFRGFAEECKRMFGRVVPMDAVRGNERHFAMTIRQPLGVVAAIVPFNYPVELWGHKAAAALAAGNAVIVKPASACPLTLLKIAALMEEAGLPRAAHQVITGSGAVLGEFLARSPGIQLVTVTGSTQVGIRISQLASETLKKVIMELGGNDPMIVLADADIEKATDAVVLGRLARGNGQICCAVKRVFVEDKIFDRFADLLARKAANLKMGDQLCEDTELGPLISEKAAIEVEEVINEVVSAGAIVRAGGHRKNSFIEATVLTNIPANVDISKREIFGPVVPLVPFHTVDEAVRMANETPFGLQAGLFTQDISRALDIAYRIEAGGVIINWSPALRVETLPFGGVKMSGNGREGIHDTLEEMTEQKTIVIHNAFSDYWQE